MSFSSEVKEELVKKTDSARHCQIAEFAAFMGMSGNVSETDNGELCLEFVTENELSVEKFSDLLLRIRFFGLDAKVIVRKNSFVVYMKEGNNITDTLNLMGAVVSQMNLYNVMILKGISNDVNRKVNCETANLNKTIEAAVKQIKDIELIRDTVGLDSLSDSLMQVALLRLENPDMSLQGLGELLDPPVGKSGVNHRLRKIGEKADELRQSMGISV